MILNTFQQPASFTVPSQGDNTLIYIDDGLLALHQFDKLSGRVLPLQQGGFRVIVHGNRPQLSIRDIQVLFDVAIDHSLAQSQLSPYPHLSLDVRNLERTFGLFEDFDHDPSASLMHLLKSLLRLVLLKESLPIELRILKLGSQPPVAHFKSLGDLGQR